KENLSLVIEAGNVSGLQFGPAQGRQQQRGKDRDNRDHDQQFDQSESALKFGSATGCVPGFHIHATLKGCYRLCSPFASIQQALSFHQRVTRAVKTSSQS